MLELGNLGNPSFSPTTECKRYQIVIVERRRKPEPLTRFRLAAVVPERI